MKGEKATDDWSSFMHSTTNSPEPDIITGADDERAPTTTKPARPLRPKSPLPKAAGPGQQSPYNMDALIIGIVGGVVAFIAIIIIIIWDAIQ